MKRPTIADLTSRLGFANDSLVRAHAECAALADRNADLAQGNIERDSLIERLRAQLVGLRAVLDAAVAQIAPPFDVTRRNADGSGWARLTSNIDAERAAGYRVASTTTAEYGVATPAVKR